MSAMIEQPTRLHEEVRALAEERQAVILAHNYQRPDVQDVADYVGDSLGLSQEAARTEADVIDVRRLLHGRDGRTSSAPRRPC